MTDTLSRRSLITGTAAAIGACTLAASRASAATFREPPIAVFAKPLQGLAPDELGRRLAVIGVQGIEATLRKGGQLEPDNLGEQLPRFCDALAQHGQRVIIAASDINTANQSSESQLRTLAKQKIPYFRMAYYRYELGEPILPQIKRFERQAAELAAVCGDLGIVGLYQNHAGAAYVGAALWDLEQVLGHVAPSQLAVAIDLRHTTLELTESWKSAYAAIRPRIGAVYAKDFAWQEGKAVNVPLGQGRAKPLWNQIVKDGLVGPISLHMEHIDHQPPELLEQRWEATRRDVETLKEWLSQGA